MVIIKLPDDVYEELERRARREGYTLVSDYVRALIYRALMRESIDIRDVINRLERLENGELPSKLYERIWGIVKSVLQEEGVLSLNTNEIINKVVVKVERRIHDMINPWTAKIDRIAQQLAELHERLELLEEMVKNMRNEISQLQQLRKQVEQITHTARPYHHAEEEERVRKRRRTAIEWLRQQGVLFESELTRLKDRDAFFEKLRREGAIIIELENERIAVDPSFWSKFKERVEALPTVNDEEIRVLLGDKMYKLFSKLKSAGLVYFDAARQSWRLSSELP